MPETTRQTDIREPVYGATADALRDALQARLVAGHEADEAYRAWTSHIDACEQCGDAFTACTEEPRLWERYKVLARALRKLRARALNLRGEQ